MSVLIVDDEAAVRDLLRHTVGGFPGHEVVGLAGSADEATQLAASCRPDIALVDFSMPGGGPAAARGILAESPRTRIVALSGHDDPAVVREMLRAGAVTYVLKGTSEAELQAVLAHVREDTDPAAPKERQEPAAAASVLVAHSDGEVVEALADAIDAAGSLELVGLAQTPFHALTLAARHRPAVALVDERMRADRGTGIATDVLAVSPTTKVIAMGAGDTRSALAMLAAGASSVLGEDDAASVVAAISRTARGGSDLTPSAARALLHPLRGTRGPRRRRFERLHSVLALDALELALQPIVALDGSAALGYEALARFPLTPVRSPDAWFADAHQAGLGLDLELLAVRSALALLDQVPQERFLAINVSPETMLAHELREALGGLDGRRVVLELTEHAPVTDYDKLRRSMDRLRRLGVRMAVDDAGAGFASLRHVALLSPEFLKLDLMLCRDVQQPVKTALTRALVGFAAETGSIVVAEGIETAEDLSALRNLGVQLGQGHLFAQPSPPPVAFAA